MNLSPLRTKLAALFVLAFLCLNVGGVACLAYCRSGDEVQAANEHCPLHKAKPECHPLHSSQQINRDQIFFDDDSVACCSLGISVFAAAFDNRRSTLDGAQTAALPPVYPFTIPAAYISHKPRIETFAPPKLDTRGLRLKHCVIRI